MLISRPFQLNGRVLSVSAFSACVLLFSVLLHIKLGMDSFWDTGNYHIFLGWSLLASRYGEFGAAAQYQSYLNPIIDSLNYLLFFTTPYLGAAFHSLFYLLFSYILFKIISELVHENEKIPLLAMIGCIVGITGAMTVSLFGSWTNENIVAVPILIGIYALLKGVKQENLLFLLFAGITFGGAAGLKLTAAHYIVGALFSCIISWPRLKPMLFLLIGMGLGFLLADGYFMYMRWILTGNPLFPFANNIFHSPYYPQDWKSFSKFEPGRIFYYLSLPVVWLSSGDFSENPTVRDGRMLLAYFGIALIMVEFFKYKKIDRQKLALVVFFIFSFLAWILAFRIYRYLIVLEALSGVLLVVGLSSVFKKPSAKTPLLIAILALPFLWYVTVYPNWGRRPWSENFATSDIVKLVSADKNSLVLFADQRVSYLAPELDRAGIKFANLYSQQWWDGERGMSTADPDYSIDPNSFNILNFDKVYFLQYSTSDPRAHSRHLSEFFKDQHYMCTEIKTNTFWSPYLCQFKKVFDLPGIDLGIEYNHASTNISFQNGWSFSEPNQRWTDGKKSTLLFRINENNNCSKLITIKGATLGKQRIGILLDGVSVFDAEIEGQFTKAIPSSLSLKRDDLVKIDFLLPTARIPGNDDSRILALAFHSIEISCQQ